MSDQVELVSEQGFGQNLMESIKGVATGGLLFVLSFVVLWKNEGCTDYAKVAKQATVVKAEAVDKSAEGKFIAVTGKLGTSEKIGDPELLNPGSYIQLERKVEMFGWVEHHQRKERKKLGGGKEITDTYTYEKDWTSSPKPPGDFKEPKGHENPPLPLERASFAANQAEVGAYPFKPGDAELPGGETLKLTDDILKSQPKPAEAEAQPAGDKADGAADGDKAKADDKQADDDADEDKPKKKKGKKRHGRRVRVARPSASERADATNVAEKKAAAIAARKPDGWSRASETYLFRGTGSVSAPEVGDVRISFRALTPGTIVTLFGSLQGGQVVSYVKDDVKFFRALNGSREEAIQTLATEDTIRAWGLRLLGFVMMWFGLGLFFGPINAILDVIPFLGSAGRFLIGIAMFPVSLVLSTFTILLAIIFHNTILLILFLAGLGAGGYFLYQKKKRAA